MNINLICSNVYPIFLNIKPLSGKIKYQITNNNYKSEILNNINNIDSVWIYSTNLNEEILNRFPEINVIYDYTFAKIELSDLYTIETTSECIIYSRLPDFEMVWLNILRQLESKSLKQSRNALTRSLYNYSYKIDLKAGFPILTLKKSFWRGIVVELLWFLSGSTNVKDLKKQNVHIWDANASLPTLHKLNLPYAEDDIGPGYGFQIRHNGQHYIDCYSEYEGFDQLEYVIELLKNEPNSRCILMSLWSAHQTHQMALPPCHVLYQWTVEDGYLHCSLYQRSWDMLLGWNPSTAALLTILLAHHLNFKLGHFHHTIADCHLYNSHNYLPIFERWPHKLPQVIIKNKYDDIRHYKVEDFALNNYNFWPSIPSAMIV